MEALFDDFSLLKADFAQNPYPSLRERREWLKALELTIRLRQDDLYKAAADDFGKRSVSETRLLELLPTLEHIRYTIRHLKDWMRPERRHVGFLFQPARNFVCLQPKGVVGVIVPWNYPIFLAFGPIVAALAAGNKVMVKMSEYTPAINHIVKEILRAALPHQVHLVEGDAGVAATFSQLPFDHLLYTGSTAVGHHVMKAASANLTPVTLELGGKSPAIWALPSVQASMLDRLVFGKTANAGQTCVAPDYVLLLKQDVQAFTQALMQRVQAFYPEGTVSSEWTAIINQRHYQRLQHLLQDAQQHGATLLPIMAHPSASALSETTVSPLTRAEQQTDSVADETSQSTEHEETNLLCAAAHEGAHARAASTASSDETPSDTIKLEASLPVVEAPQPLSEALAVAERLYASTALQQLEAPTAQDPLQTNTTQTVDVSNTTPPDVEPNEHQQVSSMLEHSGALPAQAAASETSENHSTNDVDSNTEAGPYLMPLTLVLNAPLDCQVWQDEIFGPILPIHTVDSLEEALNFVAERPRPLALYLFSHDQAAQSKVLSHSHSGGVCINDTIVHVGQDDLPFGGIGPSGMGNYHGREGFLTFSHAKAVHMKGRFSSGLMAYPQQRIKLLDKLLDWWLR